MNDEASPPSFTIHHSKTHHSSKGILRQAQDDGTGRDKTEHGTKN
jgi:hypothetical protein